MARASGDVGAAAGPPLPAVARRRRRAGPRRGRALMSPAPVSMLAIDTATDIASVAVNAGGRTFAQSIRGARQHAAQILPLVQHVMASAGVSLKDIKRIIVGDGPGSF